MVATYNFGSVYIDYHLTVKTHKINSKMIAEKERKQGTRRTKHQP